jgi:hypothetical protein
VSEYIPVNEYGSFSLPLAQTWLRVVGDFNYDPIYTGQTQMEFLRTVEALRLFRVGGIEANRNRMQSRHSFLQGGIYTLSGSSRHSPFAYTLSSSDAATLNSILHDVAPHLPDPSAVDSESGDTANRALRSDPAGTSVSV